MTQRININTPYFRNTNVLNNIEKPLENDNYEIVFNSKVKEDDIVVVVDLIDKENPINNHLKDNVLLWKSESNLDKHLKDTYIREFGYFISNIKTSKIKSIFGLSPICFQTWITDKKYQNLDILSQKNKTISVITSNHMIFGLHMYRYSFIKFLQKQKNNFIDVFGFEKKVPIEYGLLNYKYTIVLENNQEENMWSEKLTDAMRMKCFIFYFGSKNIEEYFDSRSIIKIDIRNHKSALQIIKDAVNKDEFQNNIEAIENNFRKVSKLDIKDYIVNVLESNNIFLSKDINGLLFKNKITKPFSRSRVPLFIFLKKYIYTDSIKKIFKILRMKLSDKYRKEKYEEYNSTYRNIK